jgi:hypothetical protein
VVARTQPEYEEIKYIVDEIPAESSGHLTAKFIKYNQICGKTSEAILFCDFPKLFGTQKKCLKFLRI